MTNNVELIKGLIFRIENNPTMRKNKKLRMQLYNKAKTYFNGVFEEEDDEVFAKDFESLVSSNSIRPYISSNSFPRDYDEYARYPLLYNFSNDFRYELRWLISVLEFYSVEISYFISARENYENYILLNEYEKALAIVEDIEEKFGVSLWSGECKCFLCANLDNKPSTTVNNSSQNVFRGILDYYELKNRDNVTNDEYLYIADKDVRAARQTPDNDEFVVDFFEYAIKNLAYSGSFKKIMSLFKIMRQASIIDQYNFAIDIFNYAVNEDEDDEIYINVKKYIHHLSDINDDHLIALRFVFDEKENRKKDYTLKCRLENAKAEFIKGELKNARNMAVELLKLFPNNTEAINLLVDTNILLDDEVDEFANTNLGELIRRLKSIYTLNKNRDDEIDEVNKFINCLSWSYFSRSIRNSMFYRCQGYEELNANNFELIMNLQCLDVETVIAALPQEECIEFIEEKLDTSNQYIAFRRALCKKDFWGADYLCNIKSIKDLIFVCDDNNSIGSKLSRLGKVEGTDAAIAIMRIKYFIASIDLEENLEIVLNLATNLIIDNIFTSLFIPLRKIVDYIDEAGENVRNNICAPILYYVYTYYYNKEKLDDFYIICEDFFLYRDIDKPTKMGIYDFDKEKVIFFLKNVCNSKVLDMSIMELKNTQERDQERVEICNILCQMDPTNIKEYEKEIRETTQRLMINKELKIIDENKIHVNVEGIKERLLKEYKNDFLRYKFYRDEWLKEWVANSDNKKIIFKEKITERILKELILHIRDAFVSSDEYGLDVYLSLNIRHGTLADELRGPLNKAMLTVKKDVDTEEYIMHSHWVNLSNDNDKKIINSAISDFYNETESIIAKLKGKYIQINTEDKKTEGVFDYTQCSYLIASNIVLDEFDTFEDFFDAVIVYLWSITETHFIRIREIIKTEILDDYNSAFEMLKNKIAKVNNKKLLRDLQQKTNEAATAMPNVLDKICHWFQRSTESKHNDFDLQFAFDLGLETVKNLHPEKEFIAVALEETVSDKISGYYLKDYDGIFYNLFDNIYKKAHSQDGRTVEIRYKLKRHNGATYIYLENDFDCTKDYSDDKAKIEEQKESIKSGEYKKRIKDEGGTGIPKICNIIVSDIHTRSGDLYIFYDFVEEENKFFIEIKF